MSEYAGKKNKALVDFPKKQGKNAPGKVLDLSHDWWKDENADSSHGMYVNLESCEEEHRGRLAGPFRCRWKDHSLQWDCVLVGITRAAIHPQQGVAFALHCPAYSPISWGDSHVFRSRYSVIVGSRLIISHGHCP